MHNHNANLLLTIFITAGIAVPTYCMQTFSGVHYPGWRRG